MFFLNRWPLFVCGLLAGISAFGGTVPENGVHPNLTPELRGDICMARKMYRNAIDMYRQAPESAQTTNKIGIAMQEILAFKAAKREYERAIKLNPAYPEPLNNLGTIFYAERNYRRAIREYKRALKVSDRPSATLAVNIGSAYFDRKDFERAALWFGKAVAIDPDAFEHHNSFGTLIQEKAILQRAMFHLYLAKTYAKAGDRDHALMFLRKALEEGVKDRQKIPKMPEFAALKSDTGFQELLAENPKSL